MAEKEPDSLILEILREMRNENAIHFKLIEGRLQEVVSRAGDLETTVAHMGVRMAEMSVRMDRIDSRIDRIERRLGLIEA
jgi:hypothetical protein